MLSILIPTYNHHISTLTRELHRQASASGKAFEIIISDDCSAETYRDANRQVESMEHVRYLQQDTPLKRSANRNFLGQSARHPYLLFIDCDAEVGSEDFIEKYLECCKGDAVVCGGTAYSPSPPEQQEYLLRWFYGMKREVRTAASRNATPDASFSAFNFLIKRSLFLGNPFLEEIREYGHEDTFFGLMIASKGHIINHIDNPLIHKGLEPAEEFIKKSLEALRNLKQLISNERFSEYATRIRIVRWYLFFRKSGLAILIRGLFPLIRNPIERILLGKNPNLLCFDLYKLGYILQLDK
jgi:glycosyltransferase involved in cell wall biosynthesis